MTRNITKILTITLKNISEDNTEDEEETNVLIYAGFIIIPMIILAVVGNLLTICCFYRDKGLHKTCNVYILNLAVADFLIGAISMPIYLTYTFSNNVWLFGYHFCKVFLVFDFVTTAVTVLLMILISYDRLTLLSHWSTYHKSQTPRKAYIKCVFSWIFVFILNFPATVFWDVWTGQDITRSNDCEAQFSDSVIYMSVMAVLQFVIPLIILSAIHILIVKKIRKLILDREQLTNIPSYSGSQESTNTVIHVELKHSTYLTRLRNQYETAKGKRNTTKGTKAAKSLAILTILFAITWAPYGIVVVVQSFCPGCICVIVFETFTWILWFKSAVNPFLYAFNSNRFRENFKYFLCCRRPGYKPAN